MTGNDTQLTGEQMHARRRRKFAGWLLGFGAIGFAIGFISGIADSIVGEGVLPAWLVFPAIAVLAVGLIWFTREYFRRVDELDLMDNLWASLFGLYFYLFLQPAWQVTHDVGLVPPPDHWAIYFATVVFSLLAYVARKLGWR